MYLFHLKICISVVFSLLAMNLTLYSPTVNWYMCDEFAAFTTFSPKAVYVWVFGGVVAIA